MFGALEIENIDSFYLFVMLFMNSFSSFIEAAVIEFDEIVVNDNFQT